MQNTVSGLLELGNDTENIVHLGSPRFRLEASGMRMSNVNVDDVGQI